MSNTSETLSIWDAKNNLAYNEPLASDDALFVDTSSARGDFSLKSLYRNLNIDNKHQVHTPPRKQYTLFTGHRGCGKSTELRRIAKYLHAPQRYYVIHLDCLEKLDTNNLKYSDVLLALAAALLTQLKDQENIELDQVHLSRLENWFKERIESHAKTHDLAVEIKAGAEIKAGLPWLVSAFVGLTSKINVGSSYREELREVVRDSFSEFASIFNQLIRAAEEALSATGLGQRILFSVDGTDRLDAEDAQKFFIEDVHQLTLIESLFIYCAPIHLLRANNQLNANFGQIFRLPMLKIRDREDNPIAENYDVMRELATKRVPEYLFDSAETLDYLIRYSGGHTRDLLRLLNVAINSADDEVIDKASAEKSVKEVSNDYRRFINSQDYARLVEIDQNPDNPDDFTDEESGKMLYNLVLLEYNNYFWKSHPVINILSGYQKALKEAQN
ncbi:MAG TPA: ATP-binding protein [Leucothrix sp.]|nr:ATP-binding protein [Leucothrix sp.]